MSPFWKNSLSVQCCLVVPKRPKRSHCIPFAGKERKMTLKQDYARFGYFKNQLAGENSQILTV